MKAIVTCILAGIGIGFHAIFEAIPVYFAMSSLKDQIIAAFFGVPVIVVSIIGLIMLVVKIVKKLMID